MPYLFLIAILGGCISFLEVAHPVFWWVTTGLGVVVPSLCLWLGRRRMGSGVLGLWFIYLCLVAGWLLGGAVSLIV